MLLLCVGVRGRRRARIGDRRARGIHFLLDGWLALSGTNPFYIVNISTVVLGEL